MPKSRKGFWGPKLKQNWQRDQANRTALEAAGWQVLEVWECQLKDIAALEQRLVEFLGRNQ